MLNEMYIAGMITEAIDEVAQAMDRRNERGLASDVKDIMPFVDAGVISNDTGIVIKMKDGSVFQVTVVQSRDA